jgi:hypothetical protein
MSDGGLFPLSAVSCEYLTGAKLSACGTYRYTLDRVWDSSLPVAVFVMLNPSTADASENDNTIRRCINFAKREGYGGITVVNLFAFRATKPAALAMHPDPVGPENDAWIAAVLAKHPTVVIAAWGAYPMAAGRNAQTKTSDRAATLLALINAHGVPVKCFGTTQAGHPRHPLYLHADTPLVDYAPGKVAV